MNNLFQNSSGLAMHRKYDLKGSTQVSTRATSRLARVPSPRLLCSVGCISYDAQCVQPGC